MHILFLSDNFPPETNAPATRLVEHARVWVRSGHRVTVVTCAPNFPEGRVYAGYSNRWHQRETIDGIEVVRVKTYIAPNRGFARRVLDQLSFMASGSIAALFVARPDVVVATSPQFFAALGGWFVAALRRAPFVFELRDLWPESIAAVGALRQSALLRELERLELFLYRRASAVVAVTEAFRANLIARGIDAAKIVVVRNGVDLSRYAPQARDVEFARRFGVEDKFVIGYLGTHGMAHALPRVLEAANLLRRRHDLHFLFIGAGAARDALIARARELALDNVSFHASVPKDDMPRAWSLCDVALIHLKDEPVFATVIPSKLFECFGMGVPVLFAGPEGEAAAIVRATGSGLAVPAEDPAALAAAITQLADDRVALQSMAAASRRAASACDRGQLAQVMLAALESTVSPSARVEPATSRVSATPN